MKKQFKYYFRFSFLLALCLTVGGLFSQVNKEEQKWNVNDLPLYQLESRQILLKNTWGDTMQVTAGTLVLPEIRSSLKTNHIQISFGVLRSYTPSTLAPIEILSGGPGGSAIDMAKGSYFYLFRELRKYTDIILLDQRGSGRSIPNLACANSLSLPLQITRNAKDVLTNSILESAKECLAVFTRNGVNLDGYNSKENAEDIEDLRKALDYKKVSLYGYSYGTQLAQVYIKLHPDNV